MKLSIAATVIAMMATVGVTNANTVIQVDHTQTFQNFYGCGASWTDSAAYLMSDTRTNPSIDPRLLTAAEKTEIYNSFFSKSCDGCIGLDILRQPMGSSDFRLSDYTYEDTKGQFTIQKDLAYIIPAIQQARAINSNIKVLGVPWSAPAWAKNNNMLNGGQLKSYDQATMSAYYQYFVNYVNSYGAEGIPIWALSVQNEPQHQSGDYPTMYQNADEHGTLLRGVRSALNGANHSGIKLIAYDHNWDAIWYVQQILQNQQTRDSIDAVGWHCYGGDVATQTTIKNQYPTKEVFFTECTEHGLLNEIDHTFTGDFSWCLRNLVIGATRNWASTVIEWNMVLANNGPKIYGGCANCRGLIDVMPTGIRKNPAFYALGHVSKFIKPGAKRIYSSEPTSTTKTVAMLNPDNSSFILVLNDGSSNVTYDINGWMSANCPNITLKGNSAMTVFRNPGSLSASIYRTNDQEPNVRLKLTETITCTQIPGSPIIAPVPAPVPVPTAPVPVPTAPVPVPTAPVPVPTAPVPTPTAPVPAPTAPVACPPVQGPTPFTCAADMKDAIKKMAEECGMTVN